MCPSTQFSKLFSVVLWYIDLKFGIWIYLDIIQIKFDFCLVWYTFTWVIAVCKNLVFRTFLSPLLWYWPDIWYVNLSSHNKYQVWLLSLFCNISYCPFLKFRFPDIPFLAFDTLTWNFIYIPVNIHKNFRGRKLRVWIPQGSTPLFAVINTSLPINIHF